MNFIDSTSKIQYLINICDKHPTRQSRSALHQRDIPLQTFSKTEKQPPFYKKTSFF